jgi:hypothetical protein
VHAQFGGQENSGHKGEQNSKTIGSKKHYKRNALDESADEADEENNPGYDRYKHTIVDLRWSASISISDDVPQECCNQQSPEERQCVETDLREMHCGSGKYKVINLSLGDKACVKSEMSRALIENREG